MAGKAKTGNHPSLGKTLSICGTGGLHPIILYVPGEKKAILNGTGSQD